MARRHGDARSADEGSGTVAGIALMMLVAVLLSTVACVGNLLMCQVRARSAADTAAVSAASALFSGQPDPCSAALRVLQAAAAKFGSCHVDGEDVAVEAMVSTVIPFIPEVARSARAGPAACE